VNKGNNDVVSYHKWMTSHNFFDFGVTCSTFISLCPNIRNTGLYFYLAFDFFKLRKNGKLPTSATLKFDDTALYICTSGSIVSEGRFAIEIYKCRLAKKQEHQALFLSSF
jgi:hypothetical protein